MRKFKNIQYFIENLSNFGMGDNLVFKKTDKNINTYHTKITAYINILLILSRAQFLSEGHIQDYTDWFNDLKDDNTILGYMINNFDSNDNQFIIPKDIIILDNIAKEIINK